ncbi:hypothetical protein PIB30_035289 [Stylosanthes scabra]|uniref:Uncharacterized protein n=1 Tax=Stylosanthes scabra TaxID=79078 RepID=A0ABU6YFH6_9FABA|nr:hypothetical protein [Stylosanthes scabra]
MRYNLWYDLIAQLADSDDEEEEESEFESDEEYNDDSEDYEVDSEEENEEESDEEDDDESEEGEGNEDWLYELLIKLYEAQEREKENGNNKPEEGSDIEDEIKNVEVDDQRDKTFFIATLFNNKRVKEEIPAKCEDPGPCLDRGLTIPADFPVIKPGKKDNGGTPQVLLGRPFMKSEGFKLNYHDEIFTFKVGNTIENFHFDDFSETEKKGLHQLRNDKKNKKKKREAKKEKKREEGEADKKGWLI